MRIQFTIICLIFSSVMIGQKIRYDSTLLEAFTNQIEIEHDITVSDYFNFMDALVKIGDSVLNYPFSEHILVRNNPWIVDAFADTDYYRMMAKDSFVFDQKKLVILHKGEVLKVPDSITTCNILRDFERTRIEINIPEFRLRIFKDTVLLNSFLVRVGKNRKRFLAMGNRETDLRTKRGKGIIVKHVRDPDFYNPVNGKQFYYTKRDDGKTTFMPQIPWIETEINGVRNGQMIHPTTNPVTLGQPYSNGCIGTKEADAWIIYYNAPIGTPIEIKYQLKDLEGNELEDIYELSLR
ncbi:L,D-transpeptidase family protein [Kriegella sp. EG-1]|nr:L,D-transpeptidase family protein [Flavobacteriaceae bacterium EG-1]